MATSAYFTSRENFLISLFEKLVLWIMLTCPRGSGNISVGTYFSPPAGMYGSGTYGSGG
jgi:hypothetical protein